jgi:DNA-binding response OmpR family regulator
MSSIVLFESDDLMRGLLQEWLSAAGYSVRDGLMPGESAAPADLAIVSISMPRQECEALIRYVRRLHPSSPIIALSSHARAGLSSNGAAACALRVERVMAKPLARAELLSAIATIVRPPSASRDYDKFATAERQAGNHAGADPVAHSRR